MKKKWIFSKNVKNVNSNVITKMVLILTPKVIGRGQKTLISSRSDNPFRKREKNRLGCVMISF